MLTPCCSWSGAASTLCIETGLLWNTVFVFGVTQDSVLRRNFDTLVCMQSHKKNTLTPRWDERKWLMVQEPKTQDLRVEVFDWDRVNVKELLTINLLKGMKDTLGSKTLMGRSVLCLASLHRDLS